MRRIYISFLGAGKYEPAVYHIDNKPAKESPYVQFAELQLIGADYFDKIFIVMTKTSRDKHYATLMEELSQLGVHEISEINITEELAPENQWSWFEEILMKIDHGDELTVDLTHGFRIIPIVFSTAMNFLQKAKNINIRAVYYGAYEKDKEFSPIVDVKDFYIINEWTDAVSRLVEDADPGKLGKVAQKESGTNLDEFDDPELLNAFDSLTESLKNVDIHNISQKAAAALEVIIKKEENASVTGRILLGLVKEKFVSLVSEEPLTGKYDHDYFQLQFEVIRLLLEHKLFMQAYTVMREMLGSFGLIRMKKKAKTYNSKGRDQRSKAEVFINMLQYDEKKWKFSGDILKIMQGLMPLYKEMEHAGIIDQLRDISKELVMYRNGFDHAWTKRGSAFQDIEEKGMQFNTRLKMAFENLDKKDFFKN